MVPRKGFIQDYFINELNNKWNKKFLPTVKEEKRLRDFPGGAVVKNPPANAGDTGLSPGPGRSHMRLSN